MKTKLQAAAVVLATALTAAGPPAVRAAAGRATEPAGAAAGPQAAAGIAWHAAASDAEVDAAFAKARAERKPVFVYWGAKWCPPCNQVKATVFNRQDFIERSRAFVAVYVDGDSPGAQKLGSRFGVRGYPTMVLFSPAGDELTRLPGEVDAASITQVLTLAINAQRPVRQVLAQALAGAPGGAAGALGRPAAGASAKRPAALTPNDWRLLAFYSWETDEQQLVPKADVPALLARLAGACPPALREPATRLRLKALAAAGAAVDAAAGPAAGPAAAIRGTAVPAAARGRVLQVLADPAQSRAHMDVLTNNASDIVAALSAPGAATNAAEASPTHAAAGASGAAVGPVAGASTPAAPAASSIAAPAPASGGGAGPQIASSSPVAPHSATGRIAGPPPAPSSSVAARAARPAPGGSNSAADRASLVAAFDASLQRLQGDTTLSRADRLTALLARVDLARPAMSSGAPGSRAAPAPATVLPPALLAEVREAAARADREIRDPYERQAVVTTAAWLLSRAGLAGESDALLQANLSRSHSPYYLMADLAHNARERGDTASALRWSQQAFDAAEGPATRLQWGASHIAMLVDLAPADEPRIERAARQLFAEAARQPDAFFERSGRSLKRVADKLVAWNAGDAHAPALQRLQSAVGATCARLPAGDAQRASCEALFKAPPAAKAA